jgi:hypothetical protein
MLQFSQYGADGAHVELLFQTAQMDGQATRAWVASAKIPS